MTDPQPAPQEEEPDGDTAAPVPPNEDGAQRIAELEKKAADATDKMLRALAELENTRKRAERERQDMAKFAVSGFARELLNVADNLKRALSAITPEAREKSPELKSIATGVEMTERELLRVFAQNGIRPVETLGKKFDPNLHEVMFEGDSDQPPGTIIQVIEGGYTIHDRLLRPARVGVAKGAETSAGVDQEV
jgi:molecular chaperone GrpE